MLPQVVRLQSHFSIKYLNEVFQFFLSEYLKLLEDGGCEDEVFALLPDVFHNHYISIIINLN